MTYDDYVCALQSHDWEYEMSDDQRVWRKGNIERTALRNAQLIFDPYFRLWNMYAPKGHHRMPPAPTPMRDWYAQGNMDYPKGSPHGDPQDPRDL